ncbi:MAG: phytanoyl-CoA dioxygenase family protein [Pseudomonadales bacterium]|nr:phytanoyl-CoA dioxygenase family protein [Pseudomonadales bacterium]
MTRLVRSEPAGGSPLDDSHIASWRNEGYAFVRDLFPGDLIDTLRSAAIAHYPPPGSAEAASIADFGSGGALTFPSVVPALNELTLYEPFLQGVAQLLDTPVTELRLTQSDLWAKYGRDERLGRGDNADQRIHVDYPNHTLAHPTPWDRPEAVEVIVYFDEAEVTGGGTAFVPRQGKDDPAYRWPIVDSPGIGDLKYVNDRALAEAYFAEQRPDLAEWRTSLYEREKQADFRPGDVLFYRHDLWHRGTPMKPGTLRVVQNMTFRRASAEWISTLHVGWAWRAYRDDKLLEKLIARSSLGQRAVLGFPQPGNEYWCEETIAAVEARYGMFGMDMAPYRAALGVPGRATSGQ